MKAMTDTATGRDIFVAPSALNPQTATEIGLLFANAFGVPPHALSLDDDPAQLAAITQPTRIAIYHLEPDGDFAFKLAIDLDKPIATDRFANLACDHQLTIAWAVDEAALYGDYYVAFPSGKTAVHPLHFRETEESYACMLLPKPTFDC
ncbi:hypothetical protein FXN63_13690 [Pigmentiphaga aceris]|uniref:Uncharacterized protein n=1 Tax=Pigmentiphaga aceris TaxID=1940612 RepID=A0A5C0AYJ4_9BURK|nr:hypothetical protein [Pigmentiphaga aceris]QEI06766.1 hypothetical protein FXN63_13690 [Pigmentiphaga aceris]